MADPRDLGKGTEEAAQDSSRSPARSERFTGDPRDKRSGDEQPHVRDTLREMNREAGGVGGGLANIGLAKVVPIILIVVAVIVLLIVVGSLG